MPKVTEEYLEQRRLQIYKAAETCFMRKGLQATMQDICGEAGLSFGAVYNYFKSKDDIIAGMVEQSKEWNRFDSSSEMTGQETLLGLFDAHLLPRLEDADRMSGSGLFFEMIATAARDERISELACDIMTGIVEDLAGIVQGRQRAGTVDDDLDPRCVAWVLMSLVHGIMVQQIVDPETSVRAVVDTFYTLIKGKSVDGDGP